MDKLIQKLYTWWESEDGWIEGDPKKRGIDHSLDWKVILDKIQEFGYKVVSEEEFNRHKIY